MLTVTVNAKLQQIESKTYRETVLLQTDERNSETHNQGEDGKKQGGLVVPMILIFVVAGVGIAIAGLNWHSAALVREILQNGPWGNTILWLSGVFMFVNVTALIWRLVLFIKYRPIPDCADNALPGCTVIVPAYNEGPLVLKTLRSLVASEYPVEKLQIIAVDDGSVDDTWRWIQKAGKELEGRISTIRLRRNRGKRHALYTGIRKSTGDILVTVDSDSIVAPKTLRRLVAPFTVDARVGGVAGNVRVLNTHQGIIPRMLNVVFVYSFDFMRASQSMVNAVMCSPGALSAYRRDIVLRVLSEWRHQTFCGRPAGIGEDRAMTNLILREGYHVLFQEDATVYTDVPTDYITLCKMFLRWARSNVRETIAMSRFAFSSFRKGAMLGARINLILSWLSITLSQVLLFVTWGLLLWFPAGVVGNVIGGILITAGLSAGLYAWRYRSLNALCAYAYGIFSFACLFWIKPYALLTPHHSGWLTRRISPKRIDPKPSFITHQYNRRLNIHKLPANSPLR